jgi:hypothetical protein
VISLPVLRKLRELVEAGATIIGPKPSESASRQDFPQCDAEVKKLADEVWGADSNRRNGEPGSRRAGQGRVIWGRTAREVLLADGVKLDFVANGEPDKPLDYFHRRDGDADIYFIANRTNIGTSASCAFRATGKAPELWNPVTGERRFAAAYQEGDGRTFVPLEFAPCGSWFVVFREPTSAHPATITGNVPTIANSPKFAPIAELTGSWTVRFDTNWGGPASTTFEKLVSWPDRPEPGIKFFAGTATYVRTFDLPQTAIGNPQSAIVLDLGSVRELAEVRVNGQSCGIVWAPPFRVDVSRCVKPGANRLEVEVVNFWPNRIIGDAALPASERRTRTNIRKLTADVGLMPSGLLGPVKLLQTELAK